MWVNFYGQMYENEGPKYYAPPGYRIGAFPPPAGAFPMPSLSWIEQMAQAWDDVWAGIHKKDRKATYAAMDRTGALYVMGAGTPVQRCPVADGYFDT